MNENVIDPELQAAQNNTQANIWGAIIIVVLIVIVLSAYKPTKGIAYIIGFLALGAILIPAWRKAGYPTGF